jgi:hypothetical protein
MLPAGAVAELERVPWGSSGRREATGAVAGRDGSFAMVAYAGAGRFRNEYVRLVAIG